MPLQEIFSIFLIIVGTVLMLISAIGIIRFPDFYLRMSAIIFFNRPGLSIKSFIIITLILLTNPVGAHAISRAAYMNGTKLWEGNVVNELKDMTDRKYELEKLLKQSPNNQELLKELAGLYRKLPEAQGGDLDKALELERRMGK